MSEQYSGSEQNMSLPQPINQEKAGESYEKDHTKAVETGSGPAVVPSAPSVTTASSSSPPNIAAASVGVTQSGTSSPQIADDVDLIEKEWVERAKRIVEQTKNDPYQQSEELHATKDDYQLKRFNRDSNLKDAA